MKVASNTMPSSYNEENSFHSLPFINCLLRLFCLKCNVTDNLHSSLCLIRQIVIAIIFGILAVLSLLYKLRNIYSTLSISVTLTDGVQTVFDYCQYMVDLYFVYQYGRHVCYQYLKQYTAIDAIMGPSRYCAAIKQRMAKLTAFFITVWLVSSVGDYAAWVMSYKWTVPLSFSLTYVYVLIKILTTIDLTLQVIHIQCRLRTVGDIAQAYYTNAEAIHVDHTSSMDDTVQCKNWFYSDKCKSGSDVHITNMMPKSNLQMKWLSRCYLLITEQCQYVNRMFGIRILLNSLSLFIDMVRFTNLIVRLIIGKQNNPNNSNYFPVVSTLMRLFMCVAILVSLVDHCEKTYRQQDRVISIIDHLFIYKNPDAELREAMTELRALMQSRPIQFHLANFFSLNYSLLISTASVVSTYTIILLQSMN